MSAGAMSQDLRDMLCALLDQGQSLLALFDPQDRLCHGNPAFFQAYGLVPGAGQPGWATLMRDCHRLGRGVLIEADDIEAWLAATLARRNRLRRTAAAVDFWDGRCFWIQESLSPEGWLLLQGTDISALRQERRGRVEEGAAQDVCVDLLEGMPQGRDLQQLLQQRMASEDAWPLCVVALGLDGVPALSQNTAPGPDDGPVRDLALRLQASTRREDACGRLGEREFLLILPTAGRGQARSIASRLLRRVQQREQDATQAAPAYTCSAGLVEARWSEPAPDLLQRALKALSLARQEGGKRLVDLDEGDDGQPSP
ncbi:diguanylate cyclase [Kinneretia asaccharophila]|uniref:diguanylate cyclase n=1 Tax=Roseateles asaccharophilus TaxID=582607 RepID=A0A4R6NCE3_9BURK|nr:diguanylate cyclase [Roseateles asaccharophilus]MDN3544949.1 diguanylate cyclase [Roseateles asaccharophilus]TDP12665.1 diguanylate cyclase (GGDEF)-like protein [Roseateles asaccharophilus]